MKQTAVEWLVEQLEQHHTKIDIKNTVVFQQAKEMEKKQMCDFAVGFMMQDRLVISYWDKQFKKK
jgi:hypothetical protein